MKRMLTTLLENPRTSIAGAATILGSLLTFGAHWLSTGTIPPAELWFVLGGALTTGAGLLASADGKSKELPK